MTDADSRSQFPDEQSEDGSFDRQEDAFRDWVEDRPDARYPAEAERYHLYVSLACPWAHRVIALRALLGLEAAIGMTVVDSVRDELIYQTVNNGVYQAGFASTQAAYEKAVYPLFDTLDMLETRLSRTAFLLGDALCETDLRLWVTLIRFDPVYHGHFKCNLRQIAQYPRLSAYTQRLFEIEGLAATVNFDHIKRHYYGTHHEINPSGIVPVGPAARGLP